jgi:kanamycin kinase
MSRAPLAAIPAGAVDVPARVVELAAGADILPVWRNELGGLTFRLTSGSPAAGIRYVKWVAAGTPELDLAAEAERLEWVCGWIAVPQVLDSGFDDAGRWLLTSGIDARSAVDPRWIANPALAVRAIGRGLRTLHDELPVDGCPFDWSIDRRIGQVDERIASGMTTTAWFPERRSLSLQDARARLDYPPMIDRLVVCHGDACAPNTLLDDSGSFAAHVDFGSLGLADRWADIAVAAWSAEWNYGAGFSDLLYESYGIEPDVERIRYYRLLWDLS